MTKTKAQKTREDSQNRIFAEVDDSDWTPRDGSGHVDVTLGELEDGKKGKDGWAELVQRIRRVWVDPYPKRARSVRCGTAYISKSGYEVVLFLRAPINKGAMTVRGPLEAFNKLTTRVKRAKSKGK